MIEKIILDYLNDMLNVPVYPEMPTDKPKRFVLIEKTGSSYENYINYATLALKSYAESKYQASLLNEDVKNAMFKAIQLDDIGKVDLNSDYEFIDTTKKQYRYQAVFDLVY